MYLRQTPRYPHNRSNLEASHTLPLASQFLPYTDDMEHIGELIRNIEIVGADPITRQGFTQVPNFILTKKDISVGAKLAYAMLLKYAWGKDGCFPGQVRLAEDMGAAERSIRTYLKSWRKLAC